jgi:hypothetical protein
MAGLQLTDALQQLTEAAGIVVKEQSFEQRLPCGGAEKSMVAFLGHIDNDNHMLCRSADFPAELTELGVPVNVVVLHDNLLLAVGFCCWRLYAIRRLFFYKAIITFLFTTFLSIFYYYFNI